MSDATRQQNKKTVENRTQPVKKLTGAAANGPGPGRPKGVPNKATANAREAIAAFVEDNVPRMNGLLDRIEAENGPLAAFKCIQETIEYHVPKLQRTELTGKNGGPLVIKSSPEDEKL